MLNRIAKEIELAQANAPFYVLPRFKNKYDVMEMMPAGQVDVCHLALASQDEAENLCDKLNSLYVARKVVECMRESTNDMANEYFKIRKECDDINRTSVFYVSIWESMIDAILNSKS